MRRREFLVQSGRATLGASISSFARPARSDSWHDNISYLEKQVPQLLAEYHTPGLSIAIIKDAKIVWRGGFGFKDADTRTAVDNSTVFEAGSISKPVFAYAVMKLCERHVIDLDTSLTKYTATKFVQEDSRLDSITARRVLSHTTGLPNWRSKEQPLKISFAPGEKWRYSGEGYNYLQSVITGLMGRTDSTHCGTYEEGYSVCASDFGDYMIAHVLRPFAMTSSGYVWNGAIGQNMARPHDKNGQPITYVKRSAIDVARYGSAGALLATPTDLAKFLIEVMSPKPADNYRLNEASRKEMMRPQIDLPLLDYLQDGRLLKLSWALGWMVIHLESGDVHCHGGDNEGFHSMVAMSLARKSGFVVMNNGESGYEMIAKRLMKDLLVRFV